MLGKRSPQRGLFEGDSRYAGFVGPDSFYGFLASRRGRLFRDEDFADLYCSANGRASVPPSLLATAPARRAPGAVRGAREDALPTPDGRNRRQSHPGRAGDGADRVFLCTYFAAVVRRDGTTRRVGQVRPGDPITGLGLAVRPTCACAGGCFTCAA